MHIDIVLAAYRLTQSSNHAVELSIIGMALFQFDGPPELLG